MIVTLKSRLVILAFIMVDKYWFTSEYARSNNEEAARAFCIS